ncbi:hypothetical protein [Paracoccus sp. SSK6]|uniref:hypothetical protein n=1 Tax=Paracoccus sp. SSK6 TaxID=3143131 RepID=UPI0032191BEF
MPAPEPVPLPNDVLRTLHGLRGRLGREKAGKLGLDLNVAVHFKDPQVALDEPGVGLDSDFTVPWEPGLGDGPTSARFRILPTDGKVARWDAKARCFTDSADKPIDGSDLDTPEYRQVRTWAVLQNTLDHVEGPFGMGRRLDWNFAGNRLLVDTAFSNERNAYYNRDQKRLEFHHYQDDEGATVHTCLSTDIVNHELAHAILDGVRPMFLTKGVKEHEAFHESVGDILALLLALRNNRFRKTVADRTEGDLTDGLASGLARQFGLTVSKKPHLRSAASSLTMADLPGQNFHDASQILTGAVFDYLVALVAGYRARRGVTIYEALWYAVRRVQTTFLQALDLLPPLDPRFADLGQAMVQAILIAEPLDPKGYAALLRQCFAKRGIELPSDEAARLRLTPADPDEIARSRGAAYRWLDDNRTALDIPADADLTLAGPFLADKRGPDGRALPVQISIPYAWMNERDSNGIVLQAPCGATLVIDTRSNVLSWARKPGAETEAGAARIQGLAEAMALAPAGDGILRCAPAVTKEDPVHV